MEEQFKNNSYTSSLIIQHKTEENPRKSHSDKQRKHKHISVAYGMQFASKVELFVRQHSYSTTVLNLEDIPKEELFKKVLTFIDLASTNAQLFQTFIIPFKTLDQQMELEIKKSKHSIGSSHSGMSVDSQEYNVDESIFKVRVNMVNSNEPAKKMNNTPKLRKAKTSMMSKCNRISIADAINIQQLSLLKEVEAIESAQSIQSAQQMVQFQSRGRLSSDTQSIGQLKVPEKITKNKKISIMIIEDFNSSTGSEFFSDGDTNLSLSEIQLPTLMLTEAILQSFFDTPSPFLVNLALCLLCKCLSRGGVALNHSSGGWLLGVATIVAYKLYYDEPIEGLMDWFCQEMGMELPQLLKLERWFLGSLNYEVVVTSQQYQNMMLRLMAQ